MFFFAIQKQTGKTLRVPRVQEDDLGSYTCQVDNGVDEAKSFRIELREDGEKIVRAVFKRNGGVAFNLNVL